MWGGVGVVSLREKLGEQVDNKLLVDDGTQTPENDWEKGRHCWRAESQEVREPQNDSEV